MFVQEEVFNILFVKRSKEESSFFVYCQNCALKSSPTLAEYGVLYQYEVSDLMQTYDSFVMFQVCSHVGVVSLVCSIGPNAAHSLQWMSWGWGWLDTAAGPLFNETC